MYQSTGAGMKDVAQARLLDATGTSSDAAATQRIESNHSA
jgi:hypothetical protein